MRVKEFDMDTTGWPRYRFWGCMPSWPRCWPGGKPNPNYRGPKNVLGAVPLADNSKCLYVPSMLSGAAAGSVLYWIGLGDMGPDEAMRTILTGATVGGLMGAFVAYTIDSLGGC